VVATCWRRAGGFDGVQLLPAPLDAEGRRRHPRRIDGRPASSCRRRTSSAISTDLTALPKPRMPGALLIVVVTEVVSLGLLEPPGAMGADIVVAKASRSATPLNFGGPYVGLFATREKFIRQMPGRLCGETVDADGKRGFVLTLSTREQHIRREKATSNICTNSGLCALAFTIHMTLLGEAGLKRWPRSTTRSRASCAMRWRKVPGVEVLTPRFFNEFAIRLPKRRRAGGRRDAGDEGRSSAACRSAASSRTRSASRTSSCRRHRTHHRRRHRSRPMPPR
jgi:glycine cleavage system pyridoxal-binding protein P